MAASGLTPYNAFLQEALSGVIKLSTDTLSAVLLDTTYVPNVSTHKFLSDVSSYEIAQAGYVRQTITGLTITVNGGGQTVVNCSGISFGTSVSLSARYLVLVDVTPAGPTVQPLIGYIDLNQGGSTNVSSTNSTFSITINASGLYAITP